MPDRSRNSKLTKSSASARGEVGFDLAGVASRMPIQQNTSSFPHWIANGHAGEMHYLEARNDTGRLETRITDRRRAWARSVVVCALNYNTDQPYSTHAGRPRKAGSPATPGPSVTITTFFSTKLRSLEAEFRRAVRGKQSRSPSHMVLCRYWAGHRTDFRQVRGIGWIGKNTCVLNEHLGSWLFLGVMLSSVRTYARHAADGPLWLLHSLS